MEALFGEEGDFNRYFTVEGIGSVWNYSPVSLLDPEIDVDGYREWKAAADANDFSNIGGSGKGFYEFNEQGLIEYGMMFGRRTVRSPSWTRRIRTASCGTRTSVHRRPHRSSAAAR